MKALNKTCRNVIVALLVVVSGITTAWGSHLAGSEISYRCLGDNLYEITMIIYRDCINANPEAIFDSPANIAIFDQDDNFVVKLGNLGLFTMPLISVENIELGEMKCQIPENDVCIEKGTYRTVIELPFLEGGYRIAYQRCCRNVTLTNIIDPLETGMTLITEITEKGLQECNASPEFGPMPSMFLCANELFEFDHSVSESEGDSVAYSLYIPNQGATWFQPKPVPPSPPPFDKVIYKDSFGLENLFGGDSLALTIDQTTGLITAIPQIIGQFLVGIEVREYRDGELLAVNHRDIEINVRDCQENESRFSAPSLTCNTLTVDFINSSINSNFFTWYFDWPNTELTSNEMNPSFTFPDYGTYEVALIAVKTEGCEDTIFQTVELRETDVMVDFDSEVVSGCADLSQINITGTATGSSPVISWIYTILDEGDTTILEGQTVNYQTRGSKTLEITLNAIEEGGCPFEVTKQVEVEADDTGLKEKDTILLCSGSSIQLNPGFNQNYTYSWSPSEFLDDPNSPNPIASPEETITYTVVITDPVENCSVESMVTIVVVDSDIQLDFSASRPFCDSLLVTFSNLSVNATEFTWTFGEDPDLVSTEMNPSYVYMMSGRYVVELQSYDSTSECLASVAKRITVLGDEFQDYSDTIVICAPNDVPINQNGDMTLLYEWDEDERIEDINSTNPIVRVNTNETFGVTVIDPLNEECRVRGLITVIVEDVLEFDDDTIRACPGEEVFLNPNGNPDYTYLWSPAEFFDDPTAVNPSVSMQESILFEVIVTSEADSCTGIFSKYLDIIELDFELSFDVMKTCGSSVVTLTNTSTGVNSIEWRLGDETGELIGTSDVLEFDLGSPGFYDITLVAVDEPECNTLTETIGILDLEGNNIPDTVYSCGDSITELNPNGFSGFEYMWEPADLVDDPTSFNPITSSTEQVVFVVTITDPTLEDCFTIDTLVYIPGGPDFGFNGDTLEVCPGTYTEVNPEGNPDYEYEWMPAEVFDDPMSSNPRIITDTSLTISVTIFDPVSTCSEMFTKPIEVIELDYVLDFEIIKGECGDPTIMLQNISEGVDSFIWYLGEDATGLIIGTTRDLTYTLPGGGMHYITLQAPGVEPCDTRTKSVSILPTQEEIADSLLACEPGPFTLDLGLGDGFVYMWEPAELLDDPSSPTPTADIQTGTWFVVTIIDTTIEDCSVTDSVFVALLDELQIITTPSDSMLCMTDSVLLKTDIPDPDMIEWLDPTGNLIGTSDDLKVLIEMSGFYKVNITKGVCSGIMDSVFLGLRPIDMSMDNDGPVCKGDPVGLTIINNTEFQIDSVIWSPEDIIVQGQGNETVFILPEMTTTVTATVYFSDGCVSMKQFEVPVVDLQSQINAVADPDTVFRGDPTTLMADPIDGATYQWTPSDNIANPTSSTTMVTPPESQDFIVTVDVDGCIAMDTVSVHVIVVMCEPPFVFLPNAFTPNNDGNNDILRVRGQYIEAIEFYIYNRWGELVFEANGIDDGWDGTFNSKELPADVYGYYLRVICIGGDEHTEQGNINLLR